MFSHLSSCHSFLCLRFSLWDHFPWSWSRCFEGFFLKICSWEHWAFISRVAISLLVLKQFFCVFFPAIDDIAPSSGFLFACWGFCSGFTCHSSLRARLFSLVAYWVSSLFRYFIVHSGMPRWFCFYLFCSVSFLHLLLFSPPGTPLILFLSSTTSVSFPRFSCFQSYMLFSTTINTLCNLSIEFSISTIIGFTFKKFCYKAKLHWEPPHTGQNGHHPKSSKQ